MRRELDPAAIDPAAVETVLDQAGAQLRCRSMLKDFASDARRAVFKVLSS